MCILFVFTDPNPNLNGFRLIAATNREEDYYRPTQHLHEPNQHLLGGEDLKAGVEGGMWLGVSTKQLNDIKFRLGALLNVKGAESDHGVISRGGLVRNYLENPTTFNDYVKILKGTYNAFNLVGVELGEKQTRIVYNSNAPDSYVTLEGKQIVGFGNSPFDSPFQKVIKGREKFQTIVNQQQDKEQLIEQLLQLLKWEEKHLPDEELERRAPDDFTYYSSVFVKMPHIPYGTRAHSIILVDKDWNLDFVETSMDVVNTRWITTRMRRTMY